MKLLENDISHATCYIKSESHCRKYIKTKRLIFQYINLCVHTYILRYSNILPPCDRTTTPPIGHMALVGSAHESSF